MKDLGMKSWDADLTPREKQVLNKARSQGIRLMKVPDGMAKRANNASVWDNRWVAWLSIEYTKGK